jgi:hypothetical protein
MPTGRDVEHPVSERQRRWAFAAEARGELPPGKARQWSRRWKRRQARRRGRRR